MKGFADRFDSIQDSRDVERIFTKHPQGSEPIHVTDKGCETFVDFERKLFVKKEE